MVDTTREEVFNEVIYGLGVLHNMSIRTNVDRSRGIEMALEYVKAMKEADA